MSLTALKDKAVLKATPATKRIQHLTLKAQDAVAPYQLSTVSMIAGVILLFLGAAIWEGLSFLGLVIFLTGGVFSVIEATKRTPAEAKAKEEAEAVTAKDAEVNDD